MNTTTRWMARAAVVISAVVAVSSPYAAETRPAAGGAKTDSKEAVTAELAKPVVRGSIVFKNYCVLCHGHRGDGQSRAARLYGTANLDLPSVRAVDRVYTEKIIRVGGEKLGKSKFMPMWQDELSEEQITDVVAYLDVIRQPVQRGEAVFKANCILCHGVEANGKGRASKLFNPPPADLTRSDKNDDYKKMIIRFGGGAMGRSEAMPVWGGQLSDQEIDDVVDYLRRVLVTNSKG